MSMQEATMKEAPAQGSMGVPWWLVLIEGIFAIILGLLFFSAPGMTTAVVVQFLGIYWLVAGMFKIVSIFLDSSMWGWKLFAGVLGILAGLLILQHPIWSPFVVAGTLVIVLGIQGIIFGVIGLVQAFQGAGWGPGLLGVLSVVLGIALLSNVWISALATPWVVGAFALIGGIAAVVQAFRMK
jgi:uncharacterized membrane protein HdeD (DUF308 family)